MIYLVEGIDRSGKSTFIGKFGPQRGIPIYRKEPPRSLKSKEHHAFFKGVGYAVFELFGFLENDLIIDRSFISDWVYSNRNTTLYEFDIWREWEIRFRELPICILYFHIPFDVFQKRIKKTPDEYMKLEDYDRFNSLYDRYLNDTIFPVVRILGNIPYERQIKQLKDNYEI